MGVVVVIIWALEIVDVLTFHALDRFGIEPRTFGSLPEIFSAPWLHFGWAHLASNTVPLFVLGTIILLSGVRYFLYVTLFSMVSSGLLVWLISETGSTTLGASGVIFGYLVYVLARAFYTRNSWQIIVAVIVGLFYGGLLWGVLPSAAGISWQAHLGGAIGGFLAARWLHRNNSYIG
ncbi:MAG: rhomboid family intramembrane serine protease [Propionibacterium sp.]|nr:MAG: rhomboid family intramembrane serine protease [Propionibacterium sp.]